MVSVTIWIIFWKAGFSSYETSKPVSHTSI